MSLCLRVPESGGEELESRGDESIPESRGEVPEFGDAAVVVEPSTEQDNLIEKLLTVRERAFKQAEENILNAQKKQKELYDRKHQSKVLPVGARVMLENTYQRQRKGGKLEPIWLGPYTISRDLGKGIYELSNAAGKVIKTKANIARLKEYQERTVFLMLKNTNSLFNIVLEPTSSWSPQFSHFSETPR